MLCDSIFIKVQRRARSGWLLEIGQWSLCGERRDPRAPEAVKVPIIGLGAGDTEVPLGESSLPTTLSLPDSNH